MAPLAVHGQPLRLGAAPSSHKGAAAVGQVPTGGKAALWGRLASDLGNILMERALRERN